MKKDKYITHLVWKRRVSKKRRARVLELIRISWPQARMTETALIVEGHDRLDSRLFWMFLLSGDFKNIDGEPVKKTTRKGK